MIITRDEKVNVSVEGFYESEHTLFVHIHFNDILMCAPYWLYVDYCITVKEPFFAHKPNKLILQGRIYTRIIHLRI